MIFKGINQSFSTVNEMQYENIGKFWDEMSEIYGRENLRGLGWGWKNGNSIEYCIGLKSNERIDFSKGEYMEIAIPDGGWKSYDGITDKLDVLYNEIYKDGPLTFEIEEFNENGTCRVQITRE